MSAVKPIAALLLSLLLGCSGGASASGTDANDIDPNNPDPTNPDPNNPDPNNPDPNNPMPSALCPAGAGGITVAGDKRFLFGMNYAWVDFGADFGGIASWGQSGVSSRAGEHAKNLETMRASGAGAVRWWMMPDFRGDGVVFDGSDKPSGLGGTMTKDLEEALRIADEADTYLMLCLFSFDAFFPTRDVGGQKIRGISPIVRDASSRAMLIDNVIRPLAKIVKSSAYAHRVVAWDVINEPEWAMMGSNSYGDPNYDPMSGIDPVTHEQMETFVYEVTKALHEETDSPVTVGSAAVKWANAWKNVGIDFYQPHVYDWIDQYWPYDNPPSVYGLDDKPVVIGEFPVEGLSSASLGTMLETLYQVGYAGAMPWDFHLAGTHDWTTMSAFAAKHACGGVMNSNPDPPEECVDVPPDNMYTCEQQAGWGKCNEPWMQGFCLETCGKCM